MKTLGIWIATATERAAWLQAAADSGHFRGAPPEKIEALLREEAELLGKIVTVMTETSAVLAEVAAAVPERDDPWSRFANLPAPSARSSRDKSRRIRLCYQPPRRYARRGDDHGPLELSSHGVPARAR